MNQTLLEIFIRDIRDKFPEGIPVQNIRLKSRIGPGRPMGGKPQFDKLKLITVEDMMECPNGKKRNHDDDDDEE